MCEGDVRRPDPGEPESHLSACMPPVSGYQKQRNNAAPVGITESISGTGLRKGVILDFNGLKLYLKHSFPSGCDRKPCPDRSGAFSISAFYPGKLGRIRQGRQLFFIDEKSRRCGSLCPFENLLLRHENCGTCRIRLDRLSSYFDDHVEISA